MPVTRVSWPCIVKRFDTEVVYNHDFKYDVLIGMVILGATDELRKEMCALEAQCGAYFLDNIGGHVDKAVSLGLIPAQASEYLLF